MPKEALKEESKEEQATPEDSNDANDSNEENLGVLGWIAVVLLVPITLVFGETVEFFVMIWKILKFILFLPWNLWNFVKRLWS